MGFPLSSFLACRSLRASARTVPLLAVGALVACSPSPQPIPPPIGIDAQALTFDDPGDGTLIISGVEGTLTSATTLEIGFWRLEMPSVAPTLADVAVLDDGSFSIQLPATADDVFRFQAFNATEASAPIDRIADAANPGSFAAPVRIGCAQATPAEELVLDAADGMNLERGAVVIDNSCGTPLSIDQVAVFDETGWEVTPDVAIPTDILADGTATFDVVRNASIGGERNLFGLQLIDTSMQQELRLFTVRANR